MNLIDHWSSLFFTSQRKAHGRYAPHVTHKLTYDIEGGSPKLSETPAAGPCSCPGTWPEADKLAEDLALTEMPATPERHALSIPTPRGTMKFYLQMTPARARRGWDKHSPFVVVETDKTVIKGHSDIFNPVFITFLQQYIGEIDSKRDQLLTTIY